MELETLEVILSANMEKMEEQFARIMPFVDKTINRVTQVTGAGMEKTEQNLDIDAGIKKLNNQFEKMTNLFEKQMSAMNKTASTGSEKIGDGMSKGFTKARTKVGKDVDLIVKEINSKMGQAKAQQEKLAYLRSQRQGTISTGDSKGQVKYDEQIARAEAAMTKYHSAARTLARSIQEEFAAVPQSLDNITEKMAQNEGQIEKLRSRIKMLQAEYANQKTPVGNFSDGFKMAGESKSSTKTALEIEKQSVKMQKLIASNDGLQKAYAMTEDRATALKSALAGINTKLGESSVKTGTASEAVKKVGKSTNESRNNFSKFGGLFNRTSNNIAHGSRRMSNGMGSFSRRLSSIVKQVFVFRLIYKGLRLMGTGLFSALKTNDQFASSLNQIKVNLLTAFYPIYTAILPAINALMSVVAKATGILASFIATLFGTTYSAAKQGAQGLYQNIQAMNDSGSAADKNKEKIKKLQRSLMGFDEINKIGLEDPKEEKQGIDFNTPNFEVPGWAAGANKLLADFFKPFKDSWDKHGQSVTNAWKYALREVGDLVKSIGSSFMDVWTNGTGEKMLSTILFIVRDIGLIIGNLAHQFNLAWNEAGVGTSIMQGVFDILNIILGTVEKITSATATWAKTLDFTPLLNSIDTLLRAIKPLTQNIGDGLAWFYENVLLPIAGFTIESIIPAFLDVLSGAIDVVNSSIEALKPLGKWLFDSFLQPIASWTGGAIVSILEGLEKALKGISSWIDNHQKAFETITIILGSFATAWGIVSLATGIWSGVATMAAGATSILAGAIAFLTSPITIAIAAIGAIIAVGVLLWKNWDTIREWAGKLSDAISEKWNGIKKATSESWGKVKDWTSESWKNVTKSISDGATKSGKWVSEKWTGIKTATSDAWDNIKKGTSKAWDDVGSKVRRSAETARDKASGAWSTMKTNIGGFNDTIKSTTKNAFDQVASWAGNLGKRMGDGLAKGFEAVKKGAKSIGKGIWEFPMKAVNGVISGVSWVLDKVGASSAAKSMKKYEFKYAQGTNYHPGGRALVNDGSGMNYQEAYRLPSGQTGLFPRKRNMVVDLPAGSSVLSGPKTAAMMSSGLPMYAGGVGDWFKEKWNGVKEFTGDVWDYMSNPSKLLNVGISKFTNLTGALDPGLSMAKGAISTTASAATDFVKSKMEDFFSSDNGHDGAVGDMGVFKYLSDVARKVIGQFPGMRMTSGMREGDPYYHGRRQAIDIAYPASMNGGPGNVKAANYAFENFASKVGYVITNGMVRDRSGMSGTGRSGSWRRWPDNDHYDHVHINGLLGAGDVGTGGSSGSSSNWRSQVARASNLMRQNANSSEINGVLAQIQRESSGNQNAIQNSAVWDVNMASGNPARGLLQYIPSTFNRYKVRGYGSIMNGFHQLMAFFNNSRWRSDLPYGRSGWGPSGYPIRPYAKGTPWVPEDQLAMIHKGEMIVPAAFNPNNGYDGFNTLQLPDIFREEQSDFTYRPENGSTDFKGGLAGMSESVIQAVMMAVQAGGGVQNLPATGDVVINIGGKEFGRIAVSEINKYHEQVGHTELNL